MISKYKIEFDRLQMLVIAIGCIISIYSFYFFMSNKIYLIGSDVYYYMSIADSIVENGEIQDITRIPSRPVKTPQNGIAFVHVIFSFLGIGARERIVTLVVLNYLLYLSGIYPLYKIAKLSKLRKGLPLAALLSVYLSAWHIYRINLLAINDGIFNSAMLWLVFLINNFIYLNKNSGLKIFSHINLIQFLGIIGIVMVAVHFRLNVILIIGSAVLSLIIIKEYKFASIFGSVCVLLAISFIAIYAFIEVSRFHGFNQKYLYPLFTSINIYNVKLQLWKILPRLTAGLSGLTSPILTMIFMIYPLSMIYFGWSGIKEKNFNKIFITTICFTGLWFTLTFQNARFIWYLFPFIYLIVLNIKIIKLIGYAFCLLVVFQSIQQFYIGFERPPSSNLFLYIYEENINLPNEDDLLVSLNERHPYILLNTRTYDTTVDKNTGEIIFTKELQWPLIESKGFIYLLGDRTYIDRAFIKISKMAKSNKYKVIINKLTPELNRFKGWALVEIELIEFS